MKTEDVISIAIYLIISSVSIKWSQDRSLSLISCTLA